MLTRSLLLEMRRTRTGEGKKVGAATLGTQRARVQFLAWPLLSSSPWGLLVLRAGCLIPLLGALDSTQNGGLKGEGSLSLPFILSSLQARHQNIGVDGGAGETSLTSL